MTTSSSMWDKWQQISGGKLAIKVCAAFRHLLWKVVLTFLPLKYILSCNVCCIGHMLQFKSIGEILIKERGYILNKCIFSLFWEHWMLMLKLQLFNSWEDPCFIIWTEQLVSLSIALKLKKNPKYHPTNHHWLSGLLRSAWMNWYVWIFHSQNVFKCRIEYFGEADLIIPVAR